MNTESLADALKGQRPHLRKYGMDEAIHPAQIAAFRRATPAQKMEQVVGMYHMAIVLKMAGLRMRHPDWNEEALRREAQRISTYGVV